MGNFPRGALASWPPRSILGHLRWLRHGRPRPFLHPHRAPLVYGLTVYISSVRLLGPRAAAVRGRSARRGRQPRDLPTSSCPSPAVYASRAPQRSPLPR
eukprot:3825760-Pyramimonas_sp.AAC.1